MDFKNMGAKRVCVVTDSTVRHLNAMKQVEEGLTREGVAYTIFDQCRVEPKDSSYVFYCSFCFNVISNVSRIGLRKLLNSPSHTNRMLSSLWGVDLSSIPQNL